MKYRTVLAFALTCSIQTVADAAPQKETVNYARMERDLRIMEGILDNILAGARPSPRLFGGASKGFYVEGYGVIFSVPVSSPRSTGLNDFSLPEVLGYSYGYSYSVPKAAEEHGGQNDSADSREEKFQEEIRSKAVEFLGTYADAIGQLSPSDKISVYPYDYSSKEPLCLITVRKEDVIAYRSDKMSEQEFDSAVSVTDGADTEALASQIDIMAYVLTTVLKDDQFRLNTRGRNGVRGLYLNDFGVLFLAAVPSANATIAFAVRDLMNFNADMGVLHLELETLEDELRTPHGSRDAVRKSATKKRQESIRANIEKEKKRIERWRSNCTTVFGDYGHTLRMLGDNEWIAIVADWESSSTGRRSDGSKATILRVRKKDVIAYNRGRINDNQFARRIVYTEYAPDRPEPRAADK